jgi:hypothetical protein
MKRFVHDDQTKGGSPVKHDGDFSNAQTGRLLFVRLTHL